MQAARGIASVKLSHKARHREGHPGKRHDARARVFRCACDIALAGAFGGMVASSHYAPQACQPRTSDQDCDFLVSSG